ncbi:MAG: repair protein RecN [Frankiales bacterium]|jgi:DNA repair protein RecN (Recombination protein N)|nr:repair protein RecN [Frankiales bacterium]
MASKRSPGRPVTAPDGLLEMRIQGLGVIEDAVLELGPGLTVVTGETGAGKTMVVQGLALLLGAKPDPGMIRSGADRAVVEGRLRVSADSPVAARALDAGADLDDGELILSRIVSAEGRSRAQLGGRGVPAAVLTELAERWVAVHGQSDQQRLLKPSTQRQALDRFGGDDVGGQLAAYGHAYTAFTQARRELEELSAQADNRARELDLLRFGLAEIDAVAPEAGEDATLASEVERLSHADALRTAAAQAHALLGGDEETEADVGTALAAARRVLDPVGVHDPLLASLSTRIHEAAYLLADIAGDLAAYVDDVEADPLRLAAAQERQAALAVLTRKYGPGVAGVLAWADRARTDVLALDGADDRLVLLREQVGTLGRVLQQAATGLSQARGRAAEGFASAVAAELTELAMPHARLQVDLNRSEAEDGLELDGTSVAFGPYGVDEVEILMAAHPGAAFRPLARGASGGELSRVMLGIEVVLAGQDPVPTFVFDEVDAGVGGRAAVEIGRRLARLARGAQVLVVTHLPQVAAFADQHLLVTKSDDGSVTSSDVRRLEGQDRVRELSRMLAGLDDSLLAQGHAEELLATAAEAKRAG